MTGSVDFPAEADAVRVIADRVTNPVKKPDGALGIILSAPGERYPPPLFASFRGIYLK